MTIYNVNRHANERKGIKSEVCVQILSGSVYIKKSTLLLSRALYDAQCTTNENEEREALKMFLSPRLNVQ